MGYWPKSVKRRRHNWITELGRKLVLVGCTGHHEIISVRTVSHGMKLVHTMRKMYVLNAPAYKGERAWEGTTYARVQSKGWSEDSVTVRGAKMMEII